MDGDNRPEVWVVRSEPAFKEAMGVTIWWERENSSWTTFWDRSASSDGSERKEFTNQPAALLEHWETLFWSEISGTQSLDSSFPREQSPLLSFPEGWSKNLGQPLKPRGLDSITDDSLFLPRSAGDELDFMERNLH